MSTNSAIEWTDCTWNPTSGCTRVSEGCDHCYAVRQSYRLGAMGQAKYRELTVLNGKGDRHFNGVVRTSELSLDLPLTWRKPRRVFVNSMSDLFHRDVPFEFIDKVFAVMALCPQHTFQVLTKRPERMAEYLIDHATRHLWGVAAVAFTGRRGSGICQDRCDPAVCNCEYPLRNVWLGTSVENQEQADRRIPELLKCPAAVRFLSCEPLLGPIKFDRTGCDWMNISEGIDWVIVGGESGPKARQCYTSWLDSIVAQCKSADVAVFVKQLGSNHRCVDEEFGDIPIDLKDSKGGDIAEFPEDLRVREMPAANNPVD